jgi:hypothetical protein
METVRSKVPVVGPTVRVNRTGRGFEPLASLRLLVRFHCRANPDGRLGTLRLEIKGVCTIQ